MGLLTEEEIYYLKNQCTEIQQKCKKAFDDAKIYDKFDCFMKFVLSHPLLLIGFTIAISSLVVPILLFTVFAIINVAIAFSSFVVIEVVLLMIGMTVLCCGLFFILSTVVLIALAFIMSSYITILSFSLIKKKLSSK